MFELEAIRQGGESEFYSFPYCWSAVVSHALHRTEKEESANPVVSVVVYFDDGTGAFRPVTFLHGSFVEHGWNSQRPYLWKGRPWSEDIDKPLFQQMANHPMVHALSGIPADAKVETSLIPPTCVRRELRPEVQQLRSSLSEETDAAVTSRNLELTTIASAVAVRSRVAENDRSTDLRLPWPVEMFMPLLVLGGLMIVFLWALSSIVPSGPDTTRMSDEEYQRYLESSEMFDSNWDAVVPP